MSDVKRIDNYNSIDVFKLFCAVLVIAIHTKPFANNYWLDASVGIVTRLAVPFFFCSSSFIFFKSEKAESGNVNKLIKYSTRLLRVYLIWYIIYAVIDLLRGTHQYNGFLYYIKQFVFPTNGSVLWFFPALIFSVCLVWILKYRCGWKDKTILSIAVICLLIGYSFSTCYDGLIANIPIATRIYDSIITFIGTQNGLFFGFPYVALGMLLANIKERKESIFKLSVGVVLSFVGLGIEAIVAVFIFGATITHLWIFALPLDYFVMKILVQLKGVPQNINSKIIRKVSTLTYVLHCIVMYILQYFNADKIDNQNMMLFLLTTVITLLLALVVTHLSSRKQFEFLKYLM